jgi:hypothetical protein
MLEEKLTPAIRSHGLLSKGIYFSMTMRDHTLLLQQLPPFRK